MSAPRDTVVSTGPQPRSLSGWGLSHCLTWAAGSVYLMPDKAIPLPTSDPQLGNDAELAGTEPWLSTED